MVDCCNSDQVQSCYFAMTNALKEIIIAAHEVFYNISQVISDLDFKEFKVCQRRQKNDETFNFVRALLIGPRLSPQHFWLLTSSSSFCSFAQDRSFTASKSSEDKYDEREALFRRPMLQHQCCGLQGQGRKQRLLAQAARV